MTVSEADLELPEYSIDRACGSPLWLFACRRIHEVLSWRIDRRQLPHKSMSNAQSQQGR